MSTIKRNHLFIANCLLLLATSLSFGIRAGLLNTWAHEFALDAVVFGMGICYFWPTMIGFVAENLPKTGANLATYNSAAGGTDMANALNNAKKLTGPHIINITLIISLILIVAFATLFVYMRSKNTKPLPFAGAAIANPYDNQ